jgi:hypothetical protein
MPPSSCQIGLSCSNRCAGQHFAFTVGPGLLCTGPQFVLVSQRFIDGGILDPHKKTHDDAQGLA